MRYSAPEYIATFAAIDPSSTEVVLPAHMTSTTAPTPAVTTTAPAPVLVGLEAALPPLDIARRFDGTHAPMSGLNTYEITLLDTESWSW